MGRVGVVLAAVAASYVAPSWAVAQRVAGPGMRETAPTARLQVTWHVPRHLLGQRRLTWRQADVALATAFVTALWVDAAQTRSLARGGWRGFRETNPILGPRPSVGRINTYTALAGLSTLGIAAALPEGARPWWLGAAFVVEAYTVAGTARLGVPITFR